MRCRGRTPGFDPSSAEGLFTTIDIESSAQLQSHDRRQDDNKHTVEQDGLTIRAQAEQLFGGLRRPSFAASQLTGLTGRLTTPMSVAIPWSFEPAGLQPR
jgi:hypothetical protein